MEEEKDIIYYCFHQDKYFKSKKEIDRNACLYYYCNNCYNCTRNRFGLGPDSYSLWINNEFQPKNIEKMILGEKK